MRFGSCPVKNLRPTPARNRVRFAMPMICPQCKGAFDQRIDCPSCGVRLYPQDGAKRSLLERAHDGLQLQQTPWTRIGVGLLISQGLYYGLRQLAMAALIANIGKEATDAWWDTLDGLLLQQGFQVVGLLAGGMLAGAGQRRGIVYGALMGLWNGVVFILVQSITGRMLNALEWFHQPTLQAAFGAAFGAVGGLLGSVLWKPLAPLTARGGPVVPLPPTQALRRTPAMVGPISWGRAMAGIAVAVVGAMWADWVFNFISKTAEWPAENRAQQAFLIWEISALGLLVGSALAGSSTYNGLRQGLIVGIGVTAALVGVEIARGAALPAASFLMTLTRPVLGEFPPLTHSVVAVTISTMLLAALGGWFGSQLLPPIYNLPRRKSISSFSD
jgi:hypothetical protein